VVANETPDLFIQMTRFVELDLIELQSFHPGVESVRASKARTEAADVHPVGSRRRESEQFTVLKTRRVYQDVVQMLPADTLVIRDDHIAGTEAVFAVPFDAVANHVAKIRDEVRYAADVLREQTPSRVEQAAAIIAHLIDHHVVRSALQDVRHLV